MRRQDANNQGGNFRICRSPLMFEQTKQDRLVVGDIFTVKRPDCDELNKGSHGRKGTS